MKFSCNMLVQVHRSIIKTAPKYKQELFTKNSEHSRSKVTTRGHDHPLSYSEKASVFKELSSTMRFLKSSRKQKQYQRSRTVYTNCSLTATKPLFFLKTPYFLVFCLCSYIVYRTRIKTHTVDAAFPAQIKSSWFPNHLWS